MATCVYTFTDGSNVVRLEGIPALKAYLATGDNLARLLPKVAEKVPGFMRRNPVSNAVDKAFSNDRVEMVSRTSAGITQRWANAPKVHVFYGMQDTVVPADVREMDRVQKEGGAVGEPEGFIYKGDVYLNAEEIPTEKDAARVLFHEALGHYGLRGVYGNALGDVLDQIIALRKQDVLMKVKEYGLDPRDKRQLQVAAEELLSDLAQSKPDNGFVKRAIAAIRTWLRQNVPGFASLQLSDAEIVRDYLMPARAFVESGGKEQSASDVVAAFQRGEPQDESLPDTITVNSIQRPTLNSNGMPIQNAVNNANLLNMRLNIKDNGKYLKSVPIHAIESSGDKSIYIDEHGNVQLLTQLKFKSISDLQREAELLLQEYFSPLKENQFVRVATSKDDYYHLINGTHRGSKNWATGMSEGGLSVAKIPQPVDGGEYAYIVEGEKVGNGSDGEPLLDLNTVKPITKPIEINKFNKDYQKSLIENLKSLGIDEDDYRILVTGGKVTKEEIPSAIGNTGSSSPNSDSILFSRAAPKEEQTGLVLPDQGLLRRVQANMQDNMNRVRQIQDRIAQITGKAVPSFQDYYGAETRRPGRIAARLEDARKELVQPIVEGLAKAGHTVEQLGELLHAMHAPERNERVAKINPEMDSGSGMTNEQAAAVMAKYKDAPKLRQLAAQAQKLARATLELKREYGLIDQETFDFLYGTYKNYVPLKGDGEYGPRIKRAMGHDAREEYILENISRDYEQAVVVGEKNVARQSLLAMALQNPDPELWTVGVPPKGRYVAGKVYEVRKVGSKEAEASFISEAQVNAYLEGKGSQAAQYEVIDSGGERVQSFVRPLQDNEVMVYVDGRPVRIQVIGDEQLARQLRPLDRGQMNVILEGMRSINRYLSRIYTGYNPSFILRNAVRDAITGTVNILGNEGATTAAKAWARYPTAVKAMGQWAATGKAPDSEVGKMLTEYRNQGGKTGASYMSDLEEQGKTIARMYDDAYGAGGYLADGKYGKAAKIAGRKVVGGMAHVVEVANQATENGLRFALYMAMRDQGIAPGEAAKAAKSVTVDFDRKGSMTPALGAIYLFFNPAVQGTANAIKTLVKGQKREQAWMALGALAALGLYAATSGMDDDKDRWLGTSWDTRSRNFILKIGDKTRLSIPMSYEFAPFYAFGTAMGEAMRGESKLAAAGRIMSSFFDAYFPLQGAYIEDSDNHGLDAVSAAMPTVIKPAFQAAVNRNTFGTQIAPDNQFVKDQPDNLKMYRNTKNTAYDAAAQKLASAGEAMGAGKYENDVTKISPETLKHFWRTYTGGLGTFVADSAGLARMTAEDAKQLETSDVPFVKDFIKQDDVKPIRGRFYDVINEAKKVSNEFKQAKKAADDSAMDDILNRPEKAELLGFDRMIKSTQSAVAKLRDEAVDINADPNISPSDKRAKLKELEAQEEDLYRSVIGAFK